MHALLSIVGLSLLSGLAQAAPAAQLEGIDKRGSGGSGPKVGLAVADKNLQDLKEIVDKDQGSKVSWYYTWELYESPMIREANPDAEFLPQVGPHDLDLSNPAKPKLLSKAADQLQNVKKSGSKRLLCFNEPNEKVENGGTGLSPDVVAKYYKHVIMPLQQDEGWKISHPVVSSGPPGLAWLKQFRDACRRENGGADCPTDFVSVHWYGPAAGLDGWTGQLHDFYGNKAEPKFWFTELGVPKAGQEGQGTPADNAALLKQADSSFSKANFVEAYAWFGATRPNKANAWTGAGVSLFGDDGKPNALGKMLMLGPSKSG
ncbi:glycoside hydrolase [Apiospora kogelbergensis]|uniref:Glycoside hydrolase n=1 Tax=Apiospora kogelbergensis TaxID=1337665 RepID=A0AAW0QR97_9PEZI